jgi:hypothetical protein
MTVTLAPRWPDHDATPTEGRVAATFRTPGALLRHLAATVGQSGHMRKPGSFYLGSRDRAGKPLGYSVYVADGWLRWHKLGADELDAMMRVQDRYRAFVHYLTEVLPAWQEVPNSRVLYMDNSVEATERDRWGNTRRKIIDTPHGDACY